MASLVSAVGLLVVVGLHTLFAAVATRFFRIRLETRWGAALYAAFVIPVVLLASTLLVSGPLRLGPDLGSPELAVVVTIVLPLVLGATVDVFWMPHPDEVDVAETDDER
ncbi:hypothetical protein [Salinilacihabitans rarus]|uniref:hypothetical protein n=1 Tax=Salinilacihabitans rarus TaxID=2961596 RepID=UPI0020C9106C|nr:hypothetical protein [Salinilacihabitans rarus]